MAFLPSSPIRFGVPLPIRAASLESQLNISPSAGINTDDAPTDIEPGESPDCVNVIFRYGTMEPRPVLSLKNTNPQPLNGPVLGGYDVTDVTAANYPIVSGRTQIAWYSTGSWSLLSYVPAYGIDAAPVAGATDYWDTTQIYDANRDQMMAVLANNSYQTLYCWQSGTTVFSTLTGAPMARVADTFDNYILAGNIQSGSSRYVQRIQWNDRGSASSWTGGLSGFEDLLAMKGQIVRVMSQENRVVVIGDQEVWQGLPVNFPFIFNFQPLDRNIGTPYPWTAAIAPNGIYFLGRDLGIYWLPKFGGPAQPVGQRVLRLLRDSLTNPERAFAVYDSTYNQYQLYYPIQGGTGYPQRAVFLNIAEPGTPQTASAWAPQSFDGASTGVSLTRGFEGLNASSSGTTWGGLDAAGVRWADLSLSWGQLGGSTLNRTVHLGSSNGTTYTFTSTGTADQATSAGFQPVQARWRSVAYGGFEPMREKTLLEWRADYQADSSSSVTVRFSQDQGGSFTQSVEVNLPATSQQSQVKAFPYVAARYPQFEVLSEGQRWSLYRFWVAMRASGR